MYVIFCKAAHRVSSGNTNCQRTGAETEDSREQHHARRATSIPINFVASFRTFIGCAINLHSLINSGLVPGGQKLNNRQTVFFLPIDPRDKNHKDTDTIDLNEPRHAQYMHKAWKRHQDAVYWVDINLALRKGLKFYQTRSNAIILHDTLPAYCIPKVVRMETGEVIHEKVYRVFRWLGPFPTHD